MERLDRLTAALTAPAAAGAGGATGNLAAGDDMLAATDRRRWILGLSRLGWGLTLLTLPGDVARAMGADDVRPVRRLGRVLGARHVLQAAIELASWPRWRRLGAAVDGLHAISAMGAAGVDRRWRRPALIDGALAGSFAATGLLGRPGPPPRR